MKVFTIASWFTITTIVVVLTIWVAPARGAKPVVRTSSQTYDYQQQRNARVICKVFGRYCGQALRVAWCESFYRTWARNGQYRGLFQMGAWERSRFGHHPTSAVIQARAARRYFILSGRDWSPWSCRP